MKKEQTRITKKKIVQSTKHVTSQTRRKKRKRYSNPQTPKYTQELILAIILGSILTIVISSFFLTIVDVHGFGMVPTLRENDKVIVQKKSDLNRFDLVAFKGGNTVIQIRRVIGFPSEKIAYRDDTLLVNDQQVDEKFIVNKINESQKNGKNYTEDFFSSEISSALGIPDNYYLVLGDNRPYATDSRHYGLVAKENIIGKVSMQFFPFNEWKVF